MREPAGTLPRIAAASSSGVAVGVCSFSRLQKDGLREQGGGLGKPIRSPREDVCLFRKRARSTGWDTNGTVVILVAKAVAWRAERRVVHAGASFRPSCAHGRPTCANLVVTRGAVDSHGNGATGYRVCRDGVCLKCRCLTISRGFGSESW